MVESWSIQTDTLIRWYQRQTFRDKVLTPRGTLQDWSRVRTRLTRIINDGPNGLHANKLFGELQTLAREYGK